MNTYDQKHLELLKLIHSGQWRDICDADANELQVLVACKYVVINSGAPGRAQIRLSPAGQHYLERLSGLKAMKFPASAPISAVAQMGT
jgi:hypothetical protein